MSEKTYKSALVVLPPKWVWPSIQSIRRRYDRKIRRWPPHITLVYPFFPAADSEKIAAKLTSALVHLPSQKVFLTTLCHFTHRRSYTLWLTPEPKPFFQRLSDFLYQLFPSHSEQRQYPQGFTPHLSVGNFKSYKELEEAKKWIQAIWRPQSFFCNRVAWLVRQDPPKDVFSLLCYFYLG